MRKLTKLYIDEVSCVVKGANRGAKVMIRKSEDGYSPLMFNDAMRKADDEPRSNTDIQRTNTEDDDLKLSAKLKEIVAAMVAAAPSLHPQHAARWLLHTEQGRALLSKHTTEEQPMPDLMKLIDVVETGMRAQAKLQKRAGETDAGAFARLYESDIDFRKRDRTIAEAKQLLALQRKGTATLTPTQVGGNDAFDTSVPDSSAKAVRLLNEMATKQGRKFEDVFKDPANSKLAAATYTHAHRSSTSGSELQGDSWARE
jgi:hypothetical protein